MNAFRFPTGLKGPTGVGSEDIDLKAARYIHEQYERWIKGLRNTYGAAALPVTPRAAFLEGWASALDWVARCAGDLEP